MIYEVFLNFRLSDGTHQLWLAAFRREEDATTFARLRELEYPKDDPREFSFTIKEVE